MSDIHDDPVHDDTTYIAGLTAQLEIEHLHDVLQKIRKECQIMMNGSEIHGPWSALEMEQFAGGLCYLIDEALEEEQ
jgi:hypothetical protein